MISARSARLGFRERNWTMNGDRVTIGYQYVGGPVKVYRQGCCYFVSWEMFDEAKGTTTSTCFYDNWSDAKKAYLEKHEGKRQ